MTAEGMKTVTVVGLGYVGLPTAALIARGGYRVHGVDVSDRIVDTLRRGESPLGEPDVERVVVQSLESGHFQASKEALPADVFIICVPTPITDDKKADLSMVESAIKATAAVIRPGNLVILESTSPVGTTRSVIGAALQDAGLDPEADVDVCYCPERVYPGATISEILKNDRIVGGLTKVSAQRAKEFYQSFCDCVPITTTAEKAEYSKLMENTFRDVNIALANVFSRVAEERGIEIRDVIALANRHPRVNVHTPGPGVGGHCIPVDPWFLIEASPNHGQLLEVSRRINDTQPERLLNRAVEAGLSKGEKVAVLGAAYRGDIDDARESPTLLLLDHLGRNGNEFVVHDPHVATIRHHSGEELAVESDLDAAISGASAAIIMTDHSLYRGLQPERFDVMKGRLIVDGRNIIHGPTFVEAGFDVVAVGEPSRRRKN